MYDINTQFVAKGKKFYFMFLALGLLFLIIILYLLISNISNFMKYDGKVLSKKVIIKTSINDDGNQMYSPVYYYEVNGKIYQCGSNSSSSVYPSENNKNVYYDTQNPIKGMNEYSKNSIYWMALFLLIPLFLIFIGIININKIKKRIKNIDELNKTGKLIKNLPYRLVNTGSSVNGQKIPAICIDYTLPSGTTINLCSDPRYDFKKMDADGMVDLVIDEQNPNNYFIDFEINRLSGNQITDYYNKPVSNNVNQNINNQVINQQSNQSITQQTIQNTQNINQNSNGNNGIQ